MSSQSREIWHVEVIDDRKLLIKTVIGRTDVRDDAGRKIKSNDAFVDQKVSTFLECR